MQEPQVRLLADAKNVLGEAPIWDEREQVLWWVDNLNPSIWKYDPATGESRSWAMPENIGCLVLRENGGICAAMKSGFAFVELDPLVIRPIVTPRGRHRLQPHERRPLRPARQILVRLDERARKGRAA